MSKAAELAALIGSQSALSNRNLIINGAMQVAQRGTSTSGATGSGYFSTDRWQIANSSLGTWTVSQSTTAPDGFSNSFKMDCTTADASPASGNFLIFRQHVEAQNLQHLKFGTSSAQSLTLSFWVRSSKTGTYIAELLQPDATNRHIGNAYTISSADTWEYKTITFAGDTSGVINNDNGTGLQVNWWLGSGSGFGSGTLQTSWGSVNGPNRAVGQVNLADSTSNEWYITGVQLEVGEQDTPFEHRSYGEELSLCHRYYQTMTKTGYMAGKGNGTTSVSDCLIPTATVLRASPTIAGGSWFMSKQDGTTLYTGSGESYSVQNVSSQGVVTDIGSITNGTDNAVMVINVTDVTLDAEL